jgi:thymidylate synthase
MEKKVQDEEKRVVKDARMQQRLDDINKKVDESAKAFQKDRDKLKRSLEQFSFDLRKEMMEKVEAANSRAEQAKNELEGYMKSSRTAPSAGDAREHTLRAESEERIMRWATEMMGKNEKRYRREMDKLRADHRNDLDQLRAHRN